MTLTDYRKRMAVRESIQNAVNRYEFQRELRLSDPYALLAAAIILQGLLDNLHGFAGPMYLDREKGVWVKSFYAFLPEDYSFYAGGIGLEMTYPQLLDALSARFEHVDSRYIPKSATAWLDVSLKTKYTKRNVKDP